MAHCPDGHPDDTPLRYTEPNEFGVDGLRPALTLTRRAAEHEVAFGVALCRRLPQVAAFLRRGLIDVRKANVLIDGVLGLPEDQARGLVAAVIDDALDLATGELRARLRRECLIADPEVESDATRRGWRGAEW